MNDNPAKILKEYSEIIFYLNKVSQFYVEFSAYGRNNNWVITTTTK